MLTRENFDTLPDLPPSSIPTMNNIGITTGGVYKLLTNLNTPKAIGPDLMPTRVLKEASSGIAPVLAFIFNQSYNTGD